MLPPDEKMSKFQRLAEQGQPVKLINNYRGFPIISNANIEAIEDAFVTLKTFEYQAVCMALEGFTYLQHTTFPEVYRSTTVSVDIPARSAVVTEFTGVGNLIGKRTYIRVQPKDTIPVEVYNGEHRIPGKLADISTIGMGIYTLATFIYSRLDFREGDALYIDLKLPGAEMPVRLEGRVVNIIRQEGEYLHRLGVKILPHPEGEDWLRSYISIRQEEIMRELSMIYNSLRSEQLKGY